jgi:hypothetical protein
MTLTAELVALIQGRPPAALERQPAHILRRVARRALSAAQRRVDWFDVLVRVADPLVGHDDGATEVTGGTRVLSESG